MFNSDDSTSANARASGADHSCSRLFRQIAKFLYRQLHVIAGGRFKPVVADADMLAAHRQHGWQHKFMVHSGVRHFRHRACRYGAGLRGSPFGLSLLKT